MAQPASQDPVRPRAGTPSSVFLVGFMGAGKTTVGQHLARRLGWRFIDLDDRVEARERRTIAEIFRDSGETAFRVAETEALNEVLDEIGAGANTVIALGGGTFVQPVNATSIRQSGVPVVFLDAPVEELRRRCIAKGAVRPLFRDQEQFQRLFEERRETYMVADLRLETGGKRADESAEELISLLGLGRN